PPRSLRNAMQVFELITKLRRQLADTDATRYPPDVLLGYLNAALALLAQIDTRGVAHAIRTLTLTPGAEQQIPADAVRFLRGETTADGRSLNNAMLTVKNAISPTWRQKPASAKTRECLRDGAMPTLFWVDPPVPDGVEVKIRARLAVLPAPLTDPDGGEPLPVSAAYELALI